jgi:beta-lactam-binding protein with PASTA domain
VPKLAGKKLAAAKKSLKAAGCKVGKIKSKKSKKKKGRVIAQGRKAGSKLPAGATVPLTVSKGPKKTRRRR